MKKLIYLVCLSFSLLLGNIVSSASSSLPQCNINHSYTSWHDCVGSKSIFRGRYTGEWRNGQAHGWGVHVSHTGSMYEGMFEKNKFHGFGTMTWKRNDPKGNNSESYKGEYKRGKRHGWGHYKWFSGNERVGQFKNGVLHGYATFYNLEFCTGGCEGEYKNGKFIVGSQDTTVIPSDLAKAAEDRRRELFDQLEKYRSQAKLNYLKKANKIDQNNKPAEVTPKKPKEPIRVETNSDKIIPAASGSGFSITTDGYIITNNHVVSGCQKVKLHHQGKSYLANVVTFDARNDIAILKTEYRPSSILALRNKDAELLEDIYVAGYPFGRKISASVKVTKGIISSLSGIGNDFTRVQIDAAIQPGNSGGPILDGKGNVVGVAVQKLDVKKIYKSFGTVPENTNFGIKTSIVKNILESNNIRNRPIANKDPISKTKLGKMISEATYYISCWMTMAQVQKLKSRKAVFVDLENIE